MLKWFKSLLWSLLGYCAGPVDHAPWYKPIATSYVVSDEPISTLFKHVQIVGILGDSSTHELSARSMLLRQFAQWYFGDRDLVSFTRFTTGGAIENPTLLLPITTEKTCLIVVFSTHGDEDGLADSAVARVSSFTPADAVAVLRGVAPNAFTHFYVCFTQCYGEVMSDVVSQALLPGLTVIPGSDTKTRFKRLYKNGVVSFIFHDKISEDFAQIRRYLAALSTVESQI